jgi:glycolate oxidase FAD binding subunit
MRLQPTTPTEVQTAVRSQPHLLPRGGGSKAVLSTPPNDIPSLELSGLSGVLEYQPQEFTFTALAGTPIAEVEAILAQHGQHLPFDPLLAQRGATLGGTVAAGLSGPGRQRYGGLRDFLIGVQFVDGAGNLVRGGGKVVKNAAGFDLPKLFIGSLGRLGALTELTFKVFPGPEIYATLQLTYPHLEVALTDIYRLTTSPLELYGLDLTPGGRAGDWSLWARLGGLSQAMPARLERLREFLLSPKGGAVTTEIIEGPAETSLWQQVKEFDWLPPDWTLIKVPLTPKRIVALEAKLKGSETRRRYSAGGNLLWLGWPTSATAEWRAKLDDLLTGLDLSGLVVLGPAGPAQLGVNPGAPFTRRLKQALDPEERFLAL